MSYCVSYYKLFVSECIISKLIQFVVYVFDIHNVKVYQY